MAVTRAGAIAVPPGEVAAVTPGEVAAVAPGEVAGSDLEDLYRLLAKRVERIVRFGVQAPEPLIEDACQVAWVRLIHHQARIHRETALPWLVKTALHEAFKLLGRGRREHSLEAELETCGEVAARGVRPGPPDLVEQRERLSEIASLPVRQQRLLWLYGVGFKYEEIAMRDGVSARTVERQLQKARANLQGAGD